jgi:hypothetical protein
MIKDINKLARAKISLDEILERFSKQKSKAINVSDLQHEINNIKKEIIVLKSDLQNVKIDNKDLKQQLLLLNLQECFQDNKFDNEDNDNKSEQSNEAESSNKAISDTVKIIRIIDKVVPSKWYSKVNIIVSQDYSLEFIALIDSGSDLNCIQEGLIPSKYFEKSIEKLNYASGNCLHIKYELNNVHICQNNVSHSCCSR